MSEKGTSSSADWEKLWNNYTNALEKWRQVFENFQKATMEMQSKYNEVMEKAAAESNKDTMKDFGENWQKAMNEPGIDAFKQFGENWQKSMSEASLTSMKTYGEMMKTFAETWNKMWPNK